jgi:integrase
VLLYAGLRPGEALALQWEDLSDLGQVVRVRHDLVRIRGQQGYQLGKPKTAKGRRDVRLEDAAGTS